MDNEQTLVERNLVKRLRDHTEFCLNRIADTIRQIGFDCEKAADKIEAQAATIAALEAENERLREALVQHNERLRSAKAIADRDGLQTNWKAFRGQVTYTLAEYHGLVNEALPTSDAIGEARNV